MAVLSRTARVLAGVIALVALIGLAVQFRASLGRLGSVAETVWVELHFFTIIANLLVAVVFGGIAAARPGFATQSLLGGVTLASLLVGVVYGLLLDGLLELSGGDKLADLLLHKVTPVLVPLWWLGFAPKGRLTRRDPWVWAILPLAYFAYALIRGGAEGLYAYPFLDLAKLGWLRTGANAVLMGAAFMATGFVVVGLDAWMGGRAR
ncbi:MAG: Pr6Pr family membrane protein [Phenylobacterium sp.]|mgnify:CR=1 FL=1|uniref:Pr6Pr family membrane protein n=1 Tax=Phenylobacterium sp. TaxID=1871053 RepID=UPI0025F7B9A0|nr:Pr6Pr family membrane protein [Phenylobacterium sp.]MBT9470806.1 Pr6Pr family membrane protein [Phenylobacterium sp.]